MPNWTILPPFVPIYGPGLLAFVLALLGLLLSRRVQASWGIVAAGALLLGWMLVVPSPRAWVMPRGMVEHLVVPAGLTMLGAIAVLWVRERWAGWLGFVVLAASAWWLAGAPGARTEFWRVWFGVAGVAWALRLLRGREAAGWSVIGLVLLLGSMVGGAPMVWGGMAAVLFGAGLGVAAVRPGALLGAAAPAVAVVGTALGTGGLLRGRIGVMDLVCGLAVLAPVASRWLERPLGQRFGRAAPWLAMCVTAGLAVAVAWGGARLGHR